ncbi:MAG TPA: ABC transporter ATP-binding protein, partial [Anaerovoracaceae bacterium]|nr:ABC transporter ATP-binding protein [Anaerovoracaceae bacterium]
SEIEKNYFALSGISNLEIKDKTISFLFKGNINLILKMIAAIDLYNLWIEEPNLEEIFMHYYEKEV